ncbi:hypothetical protein J6590_088374 [Homalodisca vitripennis]|nr:hypothetical protein J6590_088374 [Homalodisca vitripennis]
MGIRLSEPLFYSLLCLVAADTHLLIIAALPLQMSNVLQKLIPSSSFFDEIQKSTSDRSIGKLSCPFTSFFSNRTSAIHRVSIGDQGGEAQPELLKSNLWKPKEGPEQ